jgi:hypothetical protein
VQRSIPAILGGALALPLLVYATTGVFARYTADDYCWAGVLRTEGFLKAQVLWYTGYSPRYAFTFLVNLVELAGPAIVPALPTIAILVWLVTLTWAICQWQIKVWQALLLAQTFALFTLTTAPDLPQSLYWQTGMLTYLLPLILASLLVGWIRRAAVRDTLRAWEAGVSLLITFVAGGLSETYLIPQNVALTLALAATLVLARGTARRVVAGHLAAALAGGVLALATIVLAPATAYRVGGSPADLWLASAAAIATAAYQVLRLARYFPYAILLCLALPGLLEVRPEGQTFEWRWFLIVTAGVAVTLPFCYFASFYAQNGNPPARSLIVPGAILIGYAMFAGYAGRGIAYRLSRSRRLALVLAVAVVPLAVAAFSLPEAVSAAQHAALWDETDTQIRASRDAGQQHVVVAPLPRYLGEDFVTSDPQDWFNVCVARYYGVQTIAAR